MLEEIIELSNFSNKTAIVYEGKSITYSDLNALTSKIATKLKSSGVTPESSIIVFLPRGIEFIATILAALKLGAFYVPLETSAQLNRLEYMKHDCDAKLLIDESFIKNLPEKADNFEPQNSGGCIIYTSGSTGKPKGVKISKSAISTHILNIIESFSITSDTKFLFLNQNSFVAHVFFIFLTLFNGGTLHIASNETRKDINKIQKYIEENAITHTSMPLQLYKFFSLKKSTLKQIYIGSEKISNVESIGDYDLYNVYGSSETLWATYFKIDKKYSNTPITMPIKGQEVILLDDNNQITKTEGVIAVSGCTSDCYVNREEENKEKYININGKNFVKTNDVAKYDENGNLIYLNRNDWMVKISGQRVEPSEIEAVIKTFDGITETVVKAFENKHNQAYLCGYFTAHNKIDLNSLRNFVSKELPSYMLPSFFVQLDEFKFNENGKLDRKSLTPPDVTQYLTEYVAPETEKENEIVDAFKKVLDLEKLGVNDDFFALGGNSIKTIALLENLKYNLSATDIMTLKTPKNIAEFCNNSTTTVEYKSNPIQEQYDLTDSEMGVYLDCLGDNRTNYNLPNMLTFPKSIVSAEKLNEILSDFVDNHIGLKANFKNINGEIKKVINNRPKTIEIIKLNGNLDEIKKEFVRPFNLENENLYRFLVCENEENIYLLLDIHHIVFDGTSITVLINSIKTVLEGGEVQAEEISALDVNIYQKESIQNGEFKESEDYIEQKFGGNEFATKIKGDVYDNDKVDTEIQHISLLDEEIREDSIKNFLNTNHITENTYFLGAFAYCLSKFTNEEEFAFGSINNGRHNKCLKNTVGMLVKTLPLVYKVDEESSICEFLQYVQNDFHQTIKYSKFSFVDFVKKYELKPEINFIYQDEMLNSAEILGETVKFEGLPNKDLISNFSLMLFKTNGRYRVELSYNNKIYSKKYISSFINFYNQVLKEFMCKSNLKDIELLTEYDKQLHLEFNSQHFEYDETKTIIDLFKEQVVKTPDNIALVYKENKYTYKELDEITDRIAKHIVSKGLKRGEYVGVLVNRSEFMYINAIGVLKSGCAYQPLDLKNPPERLNYMVENSECRLVILDRELEQLIDFNGEKLFVDKIKSLKDVDIELPKLSIEDKFVLLFTSGTTGLPKGVELSHKNALNYMLAMKKSLPIFDENCRSLEYASFGFDAHMATIYDVLTSGGTSYIASEDLKLNIIELHNYLMENKITSIFSSTQMLKQYVMQFGDNPYLKLYGAGGEAMPVLDLPKYQLVNLYGPTECTLQAACFPIDKKYNFIPIGQSFGNNITYIVDKYQRLLPIGAVGEICVAGNQVGTGYLKRDDLNKEKFITNTYDDKFEKIYKTGDIARYLPDGNLDIMGRRDMQVKIRGFRIELTEIENRILEFEGIDDATVIAKDSTAGGKYVVGYIVSKNTIDTKALKSFIKEQLPAYMVPEIIMQIEAIPHTINGKVDKRKLPEPVRAERKKSEIREKTYIEQILSDMLKDALGHDDFDVMTDFVEAGLTSISAMRFAANIYNKFNCEIKSNVLLNDYNIFKVENFITERLLEKKENVNVENNQELEEVELTQVQLGVYYETMKNLNSSIYNIPLEITLSKDLDIERLKDSFEAVLNNHSFVKTTLKQDEGKILLVKNETPAIVGKKEMSEVEYHEFRKTFSTPFVMINSKLYKACVVKTDKNCYVLFDIHHILFDGMSESVFIRELFDLYEGKGAKKEDVSFFEYAKKENENQNSDSYKNAEKYFNKLLSKFETSSEIKSDMNKSTSQGELKELSVPVDKSLVNEFCKTNNITPAQLFLSASGYAISRFVNSKDVYISTISSGRSDVRLQNTFGMFVKTLPLHVEIKNKSSVLDFINKTGEMFRNVIDNEIYPYTKIAQNFGFEPKIVYACQLGIVEDMTLGNIKAEFSSLGLNTPKFPLSIHIEENQQQEILINLQYNDALYSKELIETFANAMNTTLLNMIKNPNGNIEKVSMLNETDLKLIDSFRMSACEELETKLFHKLFENAVDKNLDKTALIATDGEFTYLELEQEANKVANCLLEKGVQIEDKIAILLPRTSDFFKTLFGVLKSGAAYIPCDIEYPKERINEILIDSGAKYIITNESKVGDYSNALDIKELLNNSDISRPNIAVKPENLAYMIYTSGSTGKPKGVMIEHRGISNYVTPHKENRHIYAFVNEVNTMLSITTVSFDMALKEFGSALCNGKTLVFASDEETKNVISLTELFNRTKVDAFNTTPSRMQQYLEYEDFVNELKNCKVIMCGAENYPMSLYKKLKSCTNARLFNTYGPTEITVSSNCLEMTDDTKQITIGKPLLNYKEFVVDCDGNELPIGVMGELYIGGQNIARGYKNLEQQTAEKFVEHNGVRVYKSGDFAKWTNNGEISILGRMDNQVKLRGLRIELDEIQNAINSFENVKSSVVVVKKINGTENLCAYFEAENQVDIEILKDALKNRLPQYMVPSAFLQMEKLPITRNGKVDKKNLPDIEVEKAIIVKSRNNVERDFCEIFAKVLNLNEVSIEDNFFEIGGSSLLVTSVIVEAQKRNYNINYSDVFAEKTPKNLAKMFADNIDIDENSEFSNYDYSKINELLSKNNVETFLNGEKQELGNVLITGTTGFLGIHMLTEFLQNENGKAYCLLRKGKFESAKERLKSLIFYYFSDEFEEYFKNRLIIIEGDITSQKTFEDLKQYDIDTVINCAANVKHFSEKNDIEEVNYNGVLNIIDYCKNNNKRLIQVSTMSIGGVNINDNLPENTKLNEQMLYFNQTLNGKYIISKFKAERAILEAVTNGLNAKIMRVGNLAARDVDGEFQINFKTNAFVGRLKAFKIIKKYPYSMVNANVEFSPIDLVAKAILLLAKAPKECVVFHPFNNHSIFMGDVIKTMQNMNMEIDFAEDNDFGAQLKKVQEDSENAKILSSLIAYQNIGHGKKVGLIGKENDYTIKVLFRLGFSWSISSAEYMTRLLDVLQGLRFFGK